jgi:hypothetical protein
MARGSLFGRVFAWMAAHPKGTLALAVLLALGPFLAKPFNMDDPLFIWTARQIHAHPWNPYGFEANWYGTASPMWSVTENPPLGSYYLALAAGMVGWSETALHLAFLLPALAVILGTHRLARRLCDRPMAAALAVLCMPVFLVSSGTVMCDVLMLAFWVWAVVFWVEGMEREEFWRLAAAGVLIALAALTKYFGVCLIPLLAVYGWMAGGATGCGCAWNGGTPLPGPLPASRGEGREEMIGAQRRHYIPASRGGGMIGLGSSQGSTESRLTGIGLWGAGLVIPLLVICGYQWATRALYGHALFSQAAVYASQMHGFLNGAKAAAGLTALSFTGGCLAAVIFLARWLWRGRVLQGLAGGAVLLSLAVFLEGTLWQRYGWLEGISKLSTEVQMMFWTIGGVCVLALAAGDVWRRRDAAAWLLALWVVGTFVFTALLNWTINGRSILPMAPAVGILLARRLSWEAAAHEDRAALWQRGRGIGWAGAAILALLVAQSDFVLATAVRQSALQTSRRYRREGQPLWFQGHWGFQYYMAEAGGIAQDKNRPGPRPGDLVVVPRDNTNLRAPDGPGEELSFPGPRWLTTMNANIGAGFYTSEAGPLPFAIGDVPPEDVDVYQLKGAPAAAANPPK